MKKRIVILILIVAVIGYMCSSFTLVKQHDRANTYRLPKSIITHVTDETIGMNEEQIIDYSLSLTAQKLEFSIKNNIANGEANCVGYAQLCAAICNEALRNNGYKNRAKCVVGYVKCCGVNLCNVAKCLGSNPKYKAFVKDHDFVELTVNGKTYYFDPSFYDVLGSKCLTVK
ncbi:MAG: hypothetical protein IKR25_02470 [Muribaculaceae bacterium]|nr:hypothetical protein [Muribaculaceae bacterium]